MIYSIWNMQEFIISIFAFLCDWIKKKFIFIFPFYESFLAHQEKRVQSNAAIKD